MLEEKKIHVNAVSEKDLQEISLALKDLRFGQVTIIIHDGVIVQLDRTERKRFVKQRQLNSETE